MMLQANNQNQLGFAIPVAPVIGLLSSKGPTKKKWNERTKRVADMTAKAEAGDEAALVELDKIATGYGGAWGTAYNRIRSAAREAAARIRARRAGAAPAPGTPPITVQPIPGVIPVAQPIPLPAPSAGPADGPPTPATPDAPTVPGASQSGGGFDAGKLVVPGLAVLGLLIATGGLGRRGRR